jgi:hypothetical protein
MTTFEFNYDFTPIDGDHLSLWSMVEAAIGHPLLDDEMVDFEIPLTVRFEVDTYGEAELVSVTYGQHEVTLSPLEERTLLADIYQSVSSGEFEH